MRRREFIRNVMAAGAGTVAATFTGSPFQPRMRFAHAQTNGNVLIAIFQRGGADGLNECVPYGLTEYYAIRPNIAIPEPNAGDPESAVDLDGFFGLHPSLRSLHDLWGANELAVFPACHYPDATRSHFSGQQNVESGQDADDADGWLNRYLVENPGAGQLRAVGLESGVPHALKGNLVVSSFSDIGNFSLNLSTQEETDLLRDLDRAYAAGADPAKLTRELVIETGRVMVHDVGVISPIVASEYSPDHGATYPDSTFGRQMMQTAQLIKADVGLEVVAMSRGGWDTHSDEGGATGRLSGSLEDLTLALKAFRQDMDTDMSRICVVTMSEFGRTSLENASFGTDHGHATTWTAFGGNVNGGMYPNIGGVGRDAYPGFTRGLQDVNGRYLDHNLDFRDVMAEALTRHMGVSDVSAILPGHVPSPVGFL